MKIKILGTRGEIEESAPYHSKKSGVLVDNTFLLDLGDKRFLKEKPEYILITHLHPDHAYFVRHHKQPDTDIPIYAPEQYDKVKIHITNKPFQLDRYKITPIPTIHSLNVKSNAYLIEHDKKRLLYTGDMIWIEKKYHHKLKNLDMVITEARFITQRGLIRQKNDCMYGHTGVPNLISLFKNFTDKIVLIHFGSWFYKDIPKAQTTLKKLGKENEVEIIVGYDGMKIDI